MTENYNLIQKMAFAWLPKIMSVNDNSLKNFLRISSTQMIKFHEGTQNFTPLLGSNLFNVK